MERKWKYIYWNWKCGEGKKRKEKNETEEGATELEGKKSSRLNVSDFVLLFDSMLKNIESMVDEDCLV